MCRVNKYIMIYTDLNPDCWWYDTKHECCLWLETSQSQAAQIKDVVDIQSITQTSICICVSGIHNLRRLLDNIEQSKKIQIFDFVIYFKGSANLIFTKSFNMIKHDRYKNDWYVCNQSECQIWITVPVDCVNTKVEMY